MIRLLIAAIGGCLLAGGLEAGLAGGGLWVLGASLGLWMWLAPLVFALLLGGRWLWTGPVLTAARDPRHRAAALTGWLMLGGGLLGLRLGVAGAVTRFVGDFRDPALIAPAAAVVATGLALAAVVAGVALFGPIRRLIGGLLHHLAAPAVAAALALAGSALVAWAGLLPALALVKDVSLWPLLPLAVAVIGGAVLARWVPTRRARLIGAVAALGAIGLGAVGPRVIAERPDVEQILTDARGLAGPLARLFDGPEAPADAPADAPDPPASPTASPSPAPAYAPAAGLDEGQPIAHSPLPPALARRWNVLVVTIDAVRADHLRLYGYARETAPNLSALGARSAVFERAYTSINATRWLIQSLFTGRMIGDIDLLHAGYYVLLQPGSGQIFERLRAAGWHTEAHNSAHLRTAMWFGLDAGFDRYVGHDSAHLQGESADALAGAFEEALDGRPAERPWAMWLHLLEPHEPYRAHPAHAFGDDPIDRYDSEIAAADAGLGRIVKALETRGLADSTVIVVTSDHGEEFGEHGRKFHGKQLYEESVRVPLVIYVPGLEPRRLTQPVSLIDAAPTLAHLTGLSPGRSPGLPGHRARSLVDVMRGGPEDTERAVFVDCIQNPEVFAGRQMAMIRGTDKVIVDMRGVDGRAARFYDLAADPGEETNLRFTQKARFAAAAAPLEAELARRRANELARMKLHHVGRAPPPDLEGPPIQIMPGLRLLGSRVDTLPWLGRRMPLLRTWFEATGPLPDLIIRHDYLDEAGRRLKRKQYRPLLGLYPTDRWAAGEVVEDLRMVRFRPAPRRFARAMLSVLRGDRVIFGPHPLGRLVPDQYTADGAEGPPDGPGGDGE